MKQKITILFLLALQVGAVNAITLSAIYNNLDSNFAVSISGQTARVQGKPWPASNLEESLVLPQTVLVIHKGIEYPILIDRNHELTSCDGIEISAKISGGKEHLAEPKIICIPNATSQQLGQKVDYYQRVLLALEPNPKGLDEGKTPFNFEISSWTSTKYPWFDKNREAQSISFTSDDSTISFEPLSVMQGYSAWGGGILPRKNHALIGHVYNTSDSALVFKRNVDDPAASASTSLANFNFEKTVLPKSTVPLASIWIPKNNSDQISLNDNQLFVYAISLGRQPKSGSYTLMGEVAGQETDIVQQDVTDIINDREKSFPDQATKITGQPNVKVFFFDTTRYKSDFFYGIATNSQGNVIVATYKKGSGQPIYTKEIGKAVLPGGMSNYFKLIVRSNTTNPDEQGPLTLELLPLKDRKKLFE